MDWEKLVMNNPHWENDYFYEYPYERNHLKLLKKNLEKSRLIKLIIGPRRVGKTVILKQLINHIIKKIHRKKVIYVLLEDEKDELWKIISLWSKEMNINLRERTYVFFDEIQYIKNWGKQVKFLYDTFPKMKIFLSGSASVLIRKGSESLAGRINEIYIPPLEFNEYLIFSKKIKPNSSHEIWKLYKEYLFKQLPEIAMGENPYEYTRSIINKIIREDFRVLFDAPDADLAESLLRIIFKKPGQIIDYTDLSNELGIDRGTISKYMNALCDSFVFRKVYNFSKNPRKVEKRKKKFYPFYTTLINYVRPFIPEEGYLLETDVFQKLNAEYYYREREKEIDVILPKCKYGIEIKTGKRISGSMLRNLITADWLKKKIIVCPPSSEVLTKGVKRYSPNMLSNIQQDCNKHEE